jgi:hypothetical protein
MARPACARAPAPGSPCSRRRTRSRRSPCAASGPPAPPPGGRRASSAAAPAGARPPRRAALQRVGSTGKLHHVDQRVAHLARQRGLQVCARDVPLRTSSSPSGTPRSCCCCCSACSSCASVMKPSAVSAWPMRTIGMRACSSIAASSSRRDQLLDEQDLAELLVAQLVAARPARRPPARRWRRAARPAPRPGNGRCRHGCTPRAARSSGARRRCRRPARTGTGRARFLVRDGAALEHRAALQLHAVGLGLALGQRQRRGVGGVEGQRLQRRGQPQARGTALKRSGSVVRDAATCTWASPAAGLKCISRPAMVLPFRPRSRRPRARGRGSVPGSRAATVSARQTATVRPRRARWPGAAGPRRAPQAGRGAGMTNVPSTGTSDNGGTDRSDMGFLRRSTTGRVDAQVSAMLGRRAAGDRAEKPDKTGHPADVSCASAPAGSSRSAERRRSAPRPPPSARRRAA